jgi:hypothetical protein
MEGVHSGSGIHRRRQVQKSEVRPDRPPGGAPLPTADGSETSSLSLHMCDLLQFSG